MFSGGASAPPLTTRRTRSKATRPGSAVAAPSPVQALDEPDGESGAWTPQTYPTQAGEASSKHKIVDTNPKHTPAHCGGAGHCQPVEFIGLDEHGTAHYGRRLRGAEARAALREIGFGPSKGGRDVFARARKQHARRAAAQRPVARSRQPRPSVVAHRAPAVASVASGPASASSSTGDCPPPTESPAGPAPARAGLAPARQVVALTVGGAR